MKKILCIDIGNTNTKWALIENNIIIESKQEDISASELESMIENKFMDAIGLCTVREDPYWLDRISSLIKVVKIHSHLKLPILNAYSSPDTLGPDRLAMVCASAARFPNLNVLSIGLGTCITYNYLPSNQVFRGGAISPGMHMRFRAMHEFTEKLPLVQPAEPLTIIGHDTAHSIISGVEYGMASEIDGMISRFRQEFDEVNVILTGGDAEFMFSKLKTHDLELDLHLVFRGIYIITSYNL